MWRRLLGSSPPRDAFPQGTPDQAKAASRLVLLEEGRTPSGDYLLAPFLAGLGPALVRLDARAAPRAGQLLPGDFVVVQRYLHAPWRAAIERHRTGLAGLAWFLDDDLLDPQALSELAAPYARKIRRMALSQRPWFEQMGSQWWVATEALATKYAGASPFLLPFAPPQLHGLGQVRHADALAAGQVGHGARHLQRAVQAAAATSPGARRPAAGSALAGVVEHAVGVDARPASSAALGSPGAPAAAARAAATRAATMALGSPSAAHQLVGRHRRHLHLQVDAVEQRARQLALVARHLLGRAAAGAAGAAEPAAGAGVHRRHQLEARRELACRAAREMVMRPVSSGSRSASSAARGIRAVRRGTARRRAPARSRPAAAVSRRPPAPRAGAVVRRAIPGAAPARGVEAPGQAGSAALASASSSLIGGSRPGRRCASIDLPVPAGPTSSRLWPPAAAISSARLARPGRARRQVGAGRGCGAAAPGTAAGSGSRRPPGSSAATTSSRCARCAPAGPAPARPRPRWPGAAPGCGRAPARAQRQRQRQRAAHRAQFAGQAQLTGKLAGAPGAAASICPLAARMPSAIGRSKRPDSLGRSAGARLTVMRLLCGKASRSAAARRARARAIPSPRCRPGPPA
jgi:hypothetical protein